MTQTIENKLVPLYGPREIIPQIPPEEYNAIYGIFTSVQQNPESFYKSGKIIIENNSIVYVNAFAIGLKILYPFIGALKNLYHLDLSYNELENIPEEIEALKNLKIMKLNNNSIQNIPKTILTLENCLKELNLNGNPLNKESKTLLEKLKEKGVIVEY